MATRLASGRSVNALARKALRVEGIDDILKNVAKVIDSTTGKQAKEVYVQAALIARDDARALAPFKTGALRKGIFAARGDMNKPNALFGVNYRIAPHAHLVEFGHGGKSPAPPKPYFRPAITRSAAAIAKTIKDGLLKVIEDAPKR